MGSRPVLVVLTSDFTGTISFSDTSGWWWNRVTFEHDSDVFEDGGSWYYTASGSEVWGWAAIEIERAVRLAKHARRLEVLRAT